MYQGHHKDGSSIQTHSAGPAYPYVLGKYEGGQWFVMAPNGDEAKFTDSSCAVRFALAAAAIYRGRQ